MKNQSVMERVFEGYEVRAVIDEDGNPWFVAKDVCEALGILDHQQATERLREDQRNGGYTIPTSRGEKKMITVSESGLYRLLFQSRKPEAKRFCDWITDTIIPEIRKTGGFGLAEARARIEQLEAEVLRLTQIVEAQSIPLSSPMRIRALQMAESVAKAAGRIEDEDFIMARYLFNCRIMGGPSVGTQLSSCQSQLAHRKKSRRRLK